MVFGKAAFSGRYHYLAHAGYAPSQLGNALNPSELSPAASLGRAAAYFCRNAWLNDITSGPTMYWNAVRSVVGIITCAGMPG